MDKILFWMTAKSVNENLSISVFRGRSKGAGLVGEKRCGAGQDSSPRPGTTPAS